MLFVIVIESITPPPLAILVLYVKYVFILLNRMYIHVLVSVLIFVFSVCVFIIVVHKSVIIPACFVCPVIQHTTAIN